LRTRSRATPAGEKIHDALEQPDELRVELGAKIPVHILYWTAWADEAGDLQTGPDVYEFDRSQREALDRVTKNNSVAQDNPQHRP
jgi:murein L,D-transpeptidase YcbB/YkuD